MTPRLLALQSQARELARGKHPVPCLAAVTAYADYLRFGHLPYAGGTFDQPGALMEELRVVHAAWSAEKSKLENRAQRRATKGRR